MAAEGTRVVGDYTPYTRNACPFWFRRGFDCELTRPAAAKEANLPNPVDSITISASQRGSCWRGAAALEGFGVVFAVMMLS